MDFGRLPEATLQSVDFTLPPEPLFNKTTLTGIKEESPKLYIGFDTWVRKDWVGKLYPLGTKETNFLPEYAVHFNTIELNATHHTLYKPEAIQNWIIKVKDNNFLFCPKFYKGITHAGSLLNKQTETKYFLESMLAFKKHLGPVFMQFSDTFSPERKEELFHFLEALPKGFKIFVEVRHPAWFATTEGLSLFDKLRSLNMGAVITDAAGRRDCCHLYLPVAAIFVRFAGTNVYNIDKARIKNWVQQIKQWLQNGLQELYFIMHLAQASFAPELSAYFIDELNRECGLRLKKPKPVPTLF